MTSQDREAFARMLYALGDTFAEAVSELRAEAYFDALRDLPVGEVLAAGRRAIRECRFFPRPVELRELIEGRTEDRAELAWAAMLRLVRRYGWPGIDGQGTAPEFPDEATRRAAMELYGGWRALCEKLPGEGPELLGVAKVFKAAYGAVARTSLAMLPPSADDARQQLADLTAQLDARGLPSGSR
jgi:hypothetical protein